MGWRRLGGSVDEGKEEGDAGRLETAAQRHQAETSAGTFPSRPEQIPWLQHFRAG
jgi:hypothetical protein